MLSLAFDIYPLSKTRNNFREPASFAVVGDIEVLEISRYMPHTYHDLISRFKNPHTTIKSEEFANIPVSRCPLSGKVGRDGITIKEESDLQKVNDKNYFVAFWGIFWN